MYAITGATGNTGRIIANSILAKGNKVRAIGRSAARLKALSDAGAEPFICNMADPSALTQAFTGVDAVYAMIPPSMISNDYRRDQKLTADAIGEAIKQSGVEYVVALSSLGAEKPEGTGPVAGLHYLEQTLNGISRLNVLHLRAAYFMENQLAQVAAIRTAGITADMLKADIAIPMIATRDIANVAADALLDLSFSGHTAQELLGERDLTMNEVTGIIGKAIERPDLTYMQLPEDQWRAGLVQHGLSEDVAGLIVELGNALNSGLIHSLEGRSAKNTTPTSFETFVQEDFIPIFKAEIIKEENKNEH
jgi:uncharacterized protein YbjT (DUF2867 family)